MNVLDLFSGIGGFSLGLERAGMRTVAFCEIDPYCRRVLAKHWPTVPIYDDVRTLTAAQIMADANGNGCSDAEGGERRWLSAGQERGNLSSEVKKRQSISGATKRRSIDVICGGFPCQDISVAAGKGAGISGERSGLWSEYARIIGEVRPRYVIVENVAALLGRGLTRVLGDLAALGFDAEWHCIPASAVGAPHRRDRVWIVAYACSSQIRDEPWRWDGARGTDPTVAGHDGALETVADARGDGFAFRSWATTEWAHAATCGGSWWLAEPDVGRSPDGFPSWLDRCVGRGLSHAESARRSEVLRGVWADHISQALRRAAGGLERIQQAEVLFAFVREYERGADEARLLVAGQEASETFLRGLRQRGTARGTPHRSGSDKQQSVEHSDALQSVSRLLARDGEAHWAGCGWEDAVPRVATGVPARVDRLRSLGNAIVPQIAEIIGRAILAADLA